MDLIFAQLARRIRREWLRENSFDCEIGGGESQNGLIRSHHRMDRMDRTDRRFTVMMIVQYMFRDSGCKACMAMSISDAEHELG